MDTTTATVLAILALVVVGLAVWAYSRKRQSDSLRQRFGPEYERTVEQHGSLARAEADLRHREKRVSKLDIRPLPGAERDRFAQSWKTIQAKFVDSPTEAVRDADRLVKELMRDMGYPVGDFDQRAADISVDHPRVVDNYRRAREVAHANERGEASTEDLRNSMIHYRELFADLLNTPTRATRKEEMTHA
jgi:hypothetical protein